MFWRKDVKQNKVSINQKISSVPKEVSEDAAETIVKERTLNHWMDQIYSEFEQNGGVKDLPGYGKPLKIQNGDPFQSILKNAGFLPPWLELQHDIRNSIFSLLKDIENNKNVQVNQKIDEINTKITKYNQQVPTPHLQKMKVSQDNINSQYNRWI